MNRKPSAPKQPVTRLFSYLAGLASGLFLAFLYSLVASQPPPAAPVADLDPVPAQNIKPKTERIDWSFMISFQRQRLQMSADTNALNARTTQNPPITFKLVLLILQGMPMNAAQSYYC